MKLLKSIAWAILLIELPVIATELWAGSNGYGYDWNNLWRIPLLAAAAFAFAILWIIIGQKIGVLPLEDEPEETNI